MEREESVDKLANPKRAMLSLTRALALLNLTERMEICEYAVKACRESTIPGILKYKRLLGQITGCPLSLSWLDDKTVKIIRWLLCNVKDRLMAIIRRFSSVDQSEPSFCRAPPKVP